VSTFWQGRVQKGELIIVYGRLSDPPLCIIILTEQTKINLRVLWKMARESMLVSRRTTLMDGGPRRVFPGEIRSEDGVSKKCLCKKGSFLPI
jgi:hypothetical protein